MGGIDGYNWSPFGGNPAPGDPDAIRAIAAKLLDLADEVEAQSRLLQSVGAGSESVWVGPAAQAFRPHLEKLPGQLAKLTASYRDASDALNEYWSRLSSAQQVALQGLAKYNLAETQIDLARARVDQADGAASAAAESYNHAANHAATAPPDPTGLTAAHVASLQVAYQQASSNLAGARSQLSAANAAAAAATAQVDSARAQARAAAGAVAAGLRGASHAGIHNPHHSWFSSIVDDVEGVAGDVVHFAEHNWEIFVPGGALLLAGEWAVKEDPSLFRAASAILGTVTLVAGLLSMVPVIGEIALPIALVSAGLQTADDLLLAADGDGSWVSVGMDVVGDVSFGAGDGLIRVGEAAGDLERITSEGTRLTSEASELTSRVSDLSTESEALHSFDGETVALLNPGGETTFAKVSDLAEATDGHLANAQEDLATVKTQIAKNRAEFAKLPDLDSSGDILRFASPTATEGVFSKTARFFSNPSRYTSSALDVNEGLGAAIRDSWRTQWSDLGRAATATSYGVGAVSTGASVPFDTKAYHDWLHPDPTPAR